ncbi:MAG: N-acetylneuraminate synthase [Candidatus Omnitrophica bacterium]|nr:N-acetylneuraminate synthase [Candidatus Omnitrophota bacterium]
MRKNGKHPSKVFIIAEAGVNHNGRMDLALKMIDAAAAAGADAVKFQTFKAVNVISRFAPKAEYQKATTGKDESQLEMAQKLEFPPECFQKLAEHCLKKKILFLSTPFDLDSIEVLRHLGLKTFKIPSGEITNLPYLRAIGRLKRKIILSTGMSTMMDIHHALKILTKEGTRLKDITLLHCNTEYPTPYHDVNLLAMRAMKKKFRLPVGYSDHTLGIEVPVAAVALGAVVIEKHFTLDKNLPGPDHKASLSQKELEAMVESIRHIEMALGTGIKKPSGSEIKNMAIARKSIVAFRNIQQGETFHERNLYVKRPGSGISPMQWDKVLGKKAGRDFKKDELIVIK